MAKLSRMSAPKIPVPKDYPDYLAQQRQKGVFRATAKPAKLSPGSAAKIRSQLSKMLK